MAENVFTEEVAEDQLQVFLDYYDLSETEIDDSDRRKVFKSSCNKLIKAIMRGHVIIECDNDDLKVTQKKSKSGQVVEYAVLSGKHKVVMDDETNDNNYKRMYQLMSSLSSIPFNKIVKFERSDLTVLENLAMLFLSV